MHSHNLPVFESNEPPKPRHSNVVDSIGLSNTIKSNERLSLPNSEIPIETNDIGAPLRDPSNEESRRQNEADELWHALKAETGYSSYFAFMKAYAADHPYMDEIHAQLTRCNTTGVPTFNILDLSNDESSRLRVVPRFDSPIDSATRVVTSLRQPPANVAVQILLWDTDGIFDENTLNALGLGLKINPPFFSALFYWKRRPQLDPRHIKIGGIAATIVRHYKPDKPDAVPIVLIACSQRHKLLARAVERKISVSPFQNPNIDACLYYSHLHDPALPTRVYDLSIGWHTDYLRVLKLCLEEEEQAADAAALVLKPLVPLLYLRKVAISDYCQAIRGKYREVELDTSIESIRDGIIPGLPKDRLYLRGLVEDSEDELNYLRRYLRSQVSTNRLSNGSWLKVEEDLIQTRQEAGRLEAEIRDWLQLQVGEWALQESKKSIELSNRQIEEGKRGQSCLPPPITTIADKD